MQIDHIFTKGFNDQEATSARVFDQEVTVPICGTDVPSRLSDHYGVSVTISANP